MHQAQLVGGPADGRFVRVEEWQREVFVPLPAPLPPGYLQDPPEVSQVLRKARYVRRRGPAAVYDFEE